MGGGAGLRLRLRKLGLRSAEPSHVLVGEGRVDCHGGVWGAGDVEGPHVLAEAGDVVGPGGVGGDVDDAVGRAGGGEREG